MVTGTDNRKEKVRLTIIPGAVVLNGMIITTTMAETIHVWAEAILHVPDQVPIVRNADPLMETQAIRNPVVLKDVMIMEEERCKEIITALLNAGLNQVGIAVIVDNNGWNAGPKTG